MAIRYVDSNATGDDSGSSWTNAYADLLTASLDTTNVIDGTVLYVASNHSKTYTAAAIMYFRNNDIYSVNSSTGIFSAGAS